MIRSIITFLLVFQVSTASAAPIPPEQWDSSVRVTLAKAFVSEVGWGTTSARVQEYALIGNVLARRWARYGTGTFQEFVKAYCTVFRRKRSWKRHLTDDMTQPRFFNPQLNWATYVPLWWDALEYADQWFNGELTNDRCKPLHWAAPYYRPQGSQMYLLNCGNTLNKYYGVR